MMHWNPTVLCFPQDDVNDNQWSTLRLNTRLGFILSDLHVQTDVIDIV